jgi:hypothetical protein
VAAVKTVIKVGTEARNIHKYRSIYIPTNIGRNRGDYEAINISRSRGHYKAATM